MSTLRVNKIANESGNGPVEFSRGIQFPVSQSFTSSDLNINLSGIATITNLQADNAIIAGIVTAKFVGNGFNIKNPPGTPSGKVIGLHLIT
jgi:hypothetical protein